MHASIPLVAATLLLATAARAQLRPAQVYLLVGPPGSGKTVQAAILSKTYKIPAVSMESLLKQELGKKTPLARALAVSLSSGELVSDEAANQVMKMRLLRPDAGQGFILDGYPTTEEQASALDLFLEENGFPKPVVIVLDAPDDLLRKRMKSRKRADDTREGIERRIQEYRRVERFSLDRYGAGNAVRVDGGGSVQTVAARIAAQIEAARSSRGLVSRPEQREGLRKRDPEPVPAP